MEIRIGRISTINYASGKAEVVYPDKDNMVTQELPFMSNEYNMPQIDDLVVVAHLSSRVENGVILGSFFNEDNMPSEQGNNIYRKDIAINGECYIKYDKESKEFILHAKSVTIDVESINFKCANGTISAKDLLTMQQNIKTLQEDVEELKSYH